MNSREHCLRGLFPEQKISLLCKVRVAEVAEQMMPLTLIEILNNFTTVEKTSWPNGNTCLYFAAQRIDGDHLRAYRRKAGVAARPDGFAGSFAFADTFAVVLTIVVNPVVNS